jgi:hypothetical protein
MTRPQNWQATAFNPATESTNQIHSDAMAKAYGYRGGLVPGVVVSGYLMNPAVLAWGKDWLDRGEAKVIVSKPLYDGLNFEVQLSAVTDQSYQAQLIDEEGTRCASIEVSLNPAPAPLPIMRGDLLLAPNDEIPPAELAEMQHLQTVGMKALGITWHDGHKMSSYLSDNAQMPEIHRLSPGGVAHGAFLLGITNWVLAGNAYMNPWVHLQTTSRFLQAVPFGTRLIAECQIKDLFGKKGHEFVDVAVNIFAADSQSPVMAADLRAIYKMRPA